MSLSFRLGWATQVKTSLGYIHNKFQASPSYNSSKFTYEDVQVGSRTSLPHSLLIVL